MNADAMRGGPAAQAMGQPMSQTVKRALKAHSDGVAAARKDRWKTALRAFREAARLAPNHPGLNYAEGVALCRHDRFDDAIEAFRRELKVVPDHPPSLTEVGTCLARTGRRREGIPYLEDGLRRMPNMPLAQYSLGLVLLSENRRAEALKALDKAISLDAGLADAYRTRGLALSMDGQYERAVQDMHVFAALDTKNYQVILELGMDIDKQARDLQAARLFETAVKLAPNAAQPHYVLGQFLINHRQFERGLHYINRALALEPLTAVHHVGLGFGRLGQGNIEEAVPAFRRACELAPNDPNAAGTLLFALQHYPGVTKAELLREHTPLGGAPPPGRPEASVRFCQ
jgi:protein O-GlcNAc transferase